MYVVTFYTANRVLSGRRTSRCIHLLSMKHVTKWRGCSWQDR